MLSWIFQAYADAFSVATFQPAKHPAQAMDEDRPARSPSARTGSVRPREPAARPGSSGSEPPLRHAA
jgi:hypothetical protein